MNVFEAGFIACPLAGMAAGAQAAGGNEAASIVVGAIAGAVIGVAASLSPILVARVLIFRTDEVFQRRFSLFQWSRETAIVLWAAATPLVAWFTAAFCVSRILGHGG